MSKRKRFSPQTKSLILKQHLQKKKEISTLCEEHGCQPSSVYQWQDALFSRAHEVFEASSSRVGRPKDAALQKKTQQLLEQKLDTKNAIIAELMEELLKEKKFNGVL